MGNVLAASSPAPPPAVPGPGSGLVSVPPGFSMPPVSGLVPPAPDRPSEDKCDNLPNPGTFEECHRKCKELFPVQMEGVKLTVNKGLSNHFQVNHTVALSTVGDSNYHFGVTYVGTKQLSPTEAFPVLVGDMDNSGSLNAQIIHQLSNQVRSKVAFQTQQSKFVNWQVDGEYRGADFTAAVTLGNPDVLVGSVLLAQRVKVPHEVTGYLGKEAVLPCQFATTTPDIKVSQVTWVKEAGGRKQNVAVYHPDHGPSYPMKGNQSRIRFRTQSLEDATLVISPLLMTDEATYTCEFATYPLGNEDGVTSLIILANPTNTAEAKEVKVGNTEQPVAVCTSAHGKPPARITWQSVLNGNDSVSQVTNADGTVTVSSQYSMVPTKESDGQRITCLIHQQTLSQPESIPVTLSILYPPEVTIWGYDDNWYLSRSEATLTCSAKGNPIPNKFVWSTPSGSLPSSVEVQEDRLVVRKVDASVNTTFICQATNRVGQVSAEQTVFVRDQPAKRQSSSAGALVGSIVGGILALVILGAVVAFVFYRRRPRAHKGNYDPKARVFGNGTAAAAVPGRNFAELDRPLKAASGRGLESYDDYEEEEEEEEEREERLPPYGYPSRRLEDEEERYDQLGPMLRLGSSCHGYEFDDMESQHDGSIISKTAVYV